MSAPTGRQYAGSRFAAILDVGIFYFYGLNGSERAVYGLFDELFTHNVDKIGNKIWRNLGFPESSHTRIVVVSPLQRLRHLQLIQHRLRSDC